MIWIQFKRENLELKNKIATKGMNECVYIERQIVRSKFMNNNLHNFGLGRFGSWKRMDLLLDWNIGWSVGVTWGNGVSIRDGVSFREKAASRERPKGGREGVCGRRMSVCALFYRAPLYFSPW